MPGRETDHDSNNVQRRKFLKGASAGAVAVGLAGCSQGGDSPTGTDEPTDTDTSSPTVSTPEPEEDIPEGGTFTYGMATNPDSANVTQASSVYSAVALNLVYEYPVWDDPKTYAPKPALYTDWELKSENFESEYADGPVLEIRWNMRDDIKFGDGEDVTAEDVLFSYDYMVENNISEFSTINNNAVTDENGSPVIEEADGDWDFRGLFSKTYAWPFNTIGAVPILPKHIWEGTNPQNFDPTENDEAVGMGPGKLTKFDKSTAMQVDIVNDTYRDILMQQDWVKEHPWIIEGGPFVDTFNYKIYGSNSAMVNAFLEGDIDTHYGSVPTSRLSEVRDTEGKGIVNGSSSGFNYFGFNLRRKPIDDATLRQAMNMAWDEVFWTQTLQNNTKINGDYPQSPGYPAGRPETYHDDAKMLEDPATELYQFRQNSPGVLNVQAVRNFLKNGKVADGSGGTYAGVEYPGTLFDVEASQTGSSKYDYTFGPVESDVLQDAGTQKEIRVDGKTIPEVMDGGPIEIITDPPSSAPRQIKAVQNWVTNLRRVGIPIETKVLSFNTLSDRAFYQQDYDIVELGWGGTSAYGASNYFFFHSNFATEGNDAFDFNATGYGLVGHTGADDMLQDAYTTLSTEDAAKKFARSMERVYLDSPYRVFTYPKVLWPFNTADWNGTVGGVVDPPFASWVLQARNIHKNQS